LRSPRRLLTSGWYNPVKRDGHVSMTGPSQTDVVGRTGAAAETTAESSANPLRAGMRHDRTPEPCVMVIFGASGDLTRRKLIPALYNLMRERLIPGVFSVVGFARHPFDDSTFRQAILEGVNEFSRSRPAQP